MSDLIVNAVYRIELCSGEQRQWKYLGQDSRRLVWWMDMESRQEFNESSLMYAWTIKERLQPSVNEGRHGGDNLVRCADVRQVSDCIDQT